MTMPKHSIFDIDPIKTSWPMPDAEPWPELVASKALNEQQQQAIMGMVQKHYQARERIKTLARAGGVSEGRYRANLKEQTERLRDFLKEL